MRASCKRARSSRARARRSDRRARWRRSRCILRPRARVRVRGWTSRRSPSSRRSARCSRRSTSTAPPGRSRSAAAPRRSRRGGSARRSRRPPSTRRPSPACSTRGGRRRSPWRPRRGLARIIHGRSGSAAGDAQTRAARCRRAASARATNIRRLTDGARAELKVGTPWSAKRRSDARSARLATQQW